MGILINWQTTLECVVIALYFAAMLSLAAFKPAGILQSSGYSCKKLMGWAGKKGNLTFTRQSLLSFCCLLSCAVISLCFTFAGKYACLAGLSGYVILFSVYLVADRKKALRVPATKTPRFTRLYVVLTLVFAIISYLFVTVINFVDYIWGNQIFNIIKYGLLAALPLLIFPLLCLSNLICKIYEIPHNSKYVKKATRKLKNSPIKIAAITGSFGKTSVKQILSHILSHKYKVLSTPRSHNTPLGVSLTINNAELENYDVFVVEMGARHVGDVAELCRICPPDISIITGICGQHLETFKTLEGVISAKGEILTATKDTAFIAQDCFSNFENYPVDKVMCAAPSDTVSGPDGTSFTLILGEDKVEVKCPLLGKHSAQNIALAASVAYKLGMSAEEISCACATLQPIEHRLQLIKSGDVNIIDDGYNSNVLGARAAIEVLKSFQGRKICVTPGLVELGVLEESENYALGEELAGLDFVILVGETLIQPVKRGYLSAGGNEEKVVVLPNLNAAQDKLKGLLQAGDTVLFLNDLPDIY